MKPFKLPYRVAAAGGMAAAAGGMGLALLYNKGRRICKQPPMPRWLAAAVSMTAGAAFAILYFPPYARRRRVTSEVYLTFDDGPDPQATPAILDTLAACDMHGTFFLLGEAAEQHPTLVQRLVREGHTIGIHGFAHEAVTFHRPRWIERDVSQTVAVIGAGVRPRRVSLYRPPFGLRGPGLGLALRRRHLKMVLWTLDSYDYLLRSPVPIRRRLEEHLLPGDIILLHDAGETGPATAEALPGILADMQRRGLQSVGL